jgi:hypothetical protein
VTSPSRPDLADWLVERAALDEVSPANQARIDVADSAELQAQVSALRAANAAELAAHPASPAVAQIEARIAAERRRRAQRRYWMLGAVTTAAAVAVAILVVRPASTPRTRDDDPEITRTKGSTRLLAFRLAGDHVEQLEADALAKPGDIIQLRYNAGGQRYGIIASIDGAGAVTLHYPASEDASPALDPKTKALPNAYELDDAPRFERFFFITDNEALDVKATLAALREVAQRDDAATARLDMPEGMRLTSLRLRKPDSNSKAPTP